MPLYLTDEGLRPCLGRCLEYLRGSSLFHDRAVVHEYHTVGRRTGEAHLM